ncbi:MAG: serine/threonine protein kinase [Myxococcales bacterium]|nr:serine/threonine protein kinase [Myxococcales bacterium]
MDPVAQPGEIIDGRYQVVRLIGRGSMADVFEALDSETKKGVALKILRGQVARNREAVERLRREAHVQSLIDHRNVAAVYGGSTTANNEPYLVVELLQGQSLRRVVRTKGAVDASFAASYIWQACQGLSAAHTVGVLHRDLKPANLMLEPSPGPVERVVLIDFGFAAQEGDARLTQAGHVVGSLAYLAPERLDGDPGSPGSDLYALGVILYELLAGRRPFVAEDEIQLINMQIDEMPLPPSQVAPERNIPPALEAVVMRCLSKSPQSRAPHAAAMAKEIEAAMTGF